MYEKIATGWPVFVLTVALFIYDEKWGWRFLGAQMIGFGIWLIVKREIPYGIQGREPSGYLTGWAAVVAGVCAALIGVVFIVFPESVHSYRGRNG